MTLQHAQSNGTWPVQQPSLVGVGFFLGGGFCWLVGFVGLVWVGFFCTPNTVAKSQGCGH